MNPGDVTALESRLADAQASVSQLEDALGGTIPDALLDLQDRVRGLEGKPEPDSMALPNNYFINNAGETAGAPSSPEEISELVKEVLETEDSAVLIKSPFGAIEGQVPAGKVVTLAFVKAKDAEQPLLAFFVPVEQGPRLRVSVNVIVGVNLVMYVTLDNSPTEVAEEAYKAATIYKLGQTVSEGGKTFTSLQGANKGNTPSTSPEWWLEVNIPETYKGEIWFIKKYVK